MVDEHPDYNEQIGRQMKEHEEYLAKHPEERKRREEWNKQQGEAYRKYLKEHPEEAEREENWINEQWIRLDERRQIHSEFKESIKKGKKNKRGD